VLRPDLGESAVLGDSGCFRVGVSIVGVATPGEGQCGQSLPSRTDEIVGFPGGTNVSFGCPVMLVSIPFFPCLARPDF